MADFLARLSDAVLGDPTLLGMQPRVPSYEDSHAEVQSILLPPQVPKGLSVQALQPLNKNLALTHRLFLESGKPSSNNPFAALMGGGQMEKDEYGRPKAYRHYALGGVVTQVTEQGGKLRVSGSLDNDLKSSATAMYDVTGSGRLTLVGQAARTRFDGYAPGSWGVSGTLRGSDYTATARVKNGPELGASYNQRLAPGSRILLGGEILLSLPTLASVTTAPPASAAASSGARRAASAASAGKPVEWTVGASYEGDGTRTAAHLDFTGSRSHTVSLHHIAKVTDRSSLATKCIVDTGSMNSMVSLGYRMRFRNAASGLYGQVDSYGNVRTVIEREPVKDVKIAFGSELRLLGQAENAFGLSITVGNQPVLPRVLSPILMSRSQWE